MSNFNRRDFLLHLAPLASVPLLLSAEETFAQLKSIWLLNPQENQSFPINEPIQIAALIKTQYPKLLRVDFRANGQRIGIGSWRTPRITWTPTQAGNYIITAEAISLQGTKIAMTSMVNVTIFNAFGLYHVVEQSLTIPGTYSNPQDDVSVAVTLTPPTGPATMISGFYHSGSTWKFRFAPNQIGTWTWSATITGQPTVTGAFNVIASTNPGFVRKHPTNFKRWLFSNDTPYNPVGIGACTFERPGVENGIKMGSDDPPELIIFIETDKIGRTFKFINLSDYLILNGNGKFNLFRWSVWNCAFELQEAIDSNGVTYDFPNGIVGDSLITALRAYGFRVIFCFLNGIGGVNNSSGAVRDNYKKYIKYCVARYGAYVDFWEIANEGNSSVTDEFNNDLMAYVKSIDPYNHQVSTSFEYNGNDPNSTVHDLTETNWTSPHYYFDPNEFTCDTTLINLINQPLSYNKQVFISEFGRVAINWDPLADLCARIISWTAFFKGVGLVFWDTSWSKNHMGGNNVSNQYIGPVLRSYIGILSNYTNEFPAGTESTAIVSNPSLVRGYVLNSPTVYGAYLHAYTNHTTPTTGITITINPQAQGRATFYNPSTGAVLGTPVDIQPGTSILSVPSFVTDIALKIC